MKYITFILVCIPFFQYAQSPLWRYLDGNIYYPSGKVGIGTTHPTVTLDVNGDMKSNALMTSGLVIGGQSPEIAYPNYRESIGPLHPDSSLWLQSPKDIYFRTGINGSEDSSSIESIGLAILRNGKIGIGTKNPNTTLRVVGDFYSDTLKVGYLYPNFGNGSQYRYLRFGKKDEYYAGLMWNRNNDNYGDGDDFTIFTYENRDIVFRPDGIGDIIFKNGNIKLGDQPKGSHKLLLTNLQDYHFIRAKDWWTEFVSHSNEGWKFKANGEEDAKVTIRARDGFIGIGETDPKVKLAIVGMSKSTNPRRDGPVYPLIRLNNTERNEKWDIGVFDDYSGIGTSGSRLGTSLGYQYEGKTVAILRPNGSWRQISDSKFKTKIRKVNNVIEKIQQIEPSIYEMKKAPGIDEYGFIAENLESQFPELVSHLDNEEESHALVNYNGMIPILTKAIQEQQTIIEEQEKKLETQAKQNQSLHNQVNQLTSELDELKNMVQQLVATKESSSSQKILLKQAQLLQNQPNPFTESTLIQYYIPKTVQSAILKITNAEGRIIKQVKINTKGKGEIQLKAKSLSAGNYWYSLILDGKLIETKQMILTQ